MGKIFADFGSEFYTLHPNEVVEYEPLDLGFFLLLKKLINRKISQ